MYRIQASPRWRFLTLATSLAVVAGMVVAVPQAHAAGPSVVTQTFTYTGSTATFTVPAGITTLTITATGGEGGNGGADATPAAPAGGYRGVVTGTVTVTPGQVLTIGVGGGGGTGASATNAGTAPPAGGSNPLTGYAGGIGGRAGAVGSSGVGGAGGAASVVRIAGVDVVAGGGGGNGGSGQFASTRGRTATGTYVGRADTTSTTGQAGINANDACTAANCTNNDGGGSGGGGGGAQGGAQGAIEFGAGTSNEWFGYGGSVGRNSTASLSGLSSSYAYYSDNNAGGSVVISYTVGPPAAPTAVGGTAGNTAVNLVWTAPTDSGQSPISNYVVRYSSNGGTSWSSDVSLGTTGTTGTVTGLTNGTAYIFQVAAVSSVGTGVHSASSASVTPLGPPSAPTISLVTPQDGALGLTLVAPGSGAPVSAYDYRVNGGSWVTVASTSTSMVIPGLLNGTSYTVEVRAESSVGVGAMSAPSSGTPQAVPGAPTISSLAVSNGAITVAFTPGFNGGGAITAYQYQLNGGSWVTVSGTSSPIQITGLAAGTTYAVALRAVNSVGNGAASTPASATTPALPGAPTISSAVIGDGTAQVRFTAGSTGGSPIQGYEYQTSAAGAWTAVPGGTSPLLLTGLTNGTTYTVKVRATNAVGTGPASSGYPVTPATVPSAPSIVGDTVAGGDQTLSAEFTAPASTGGSAITGYQYSTDAGATWRTRTDGAGTASPVLITTLSSDGSTPLTNGETYSVELRAVNAMGPGAASAVATGISQTAPSKPTITQVTASSGVLGVTFTAGSNGGSAITAYEYTIGGGWVSTGTLGTTFVIDGLTNGTTYGVQVRAINAAGTGSASTAVNGTPVGLPGQATISSVVRSDRTLTASVSVADNGGSPVTAWQYSTDNGATWFTAPGTSSPLTLTVLSSDGSTRLANGTGYALQVRAVTAVGTGPASATTIVAPASAPAAPSIAVTPGNTTITVTFALGNEGGSPITQLEYSLDAGATWVPTGTLTSPFTISGLTNGTTYQVKLRADNAIGTGTASIAAAATPRTIPGAPSSVSAVSNTSSADVSWKAPADNGGAAVTGYTASAYTTSTGTTPYSSCTTTGATSCTIPSLTNSTTYYVEVTATNAAGTGAASSPRVLVTPLARPGAPTLNALTAGDGTLSAPFTAGSAGDRTITGYQISLNGGSTWTAASGTTSPFTITGLTNGATYTVAIRAVSAAGVGAMSNTRQGTPYTYPSAPDAASIIANGGNRQITVSWPAANLNGGVLGSYTATAFTDITSGSTAGTCNTTSLTCVITGLTNGTTYYVSLQTMNSASMYSVRSAPRVAATPNTTPGAPTGVGASGGNTTATVSWIAPMSTGASAITSYTVWCSANGGTYTSCGTSSVTSATITGLVNGSSYTFKVTATNGSGTGPLSTASTAVTPLAPGTSPVLAAATSTVTGYTSTITNYNATTTYSATVTNGATVAVAGSTVTVTGLAAGAAATATVYATRAGYTNTQATVSGSALLAGIVPVLGTPTRTADGFTFTVTNYDAAVTYGVVATNGSVSISGSTVTVTGLAAGAGSLVTVRASRAGYASTSAAASSTALGAGVVPVFSAPTPLAGGYRFTITNYDAAQTYTLVQAEGTATRVGDTVTVSGLGNGVTSGTTVTVARVGYVDASATRTGSSLPDGAAPVASAVTRTADGFTFTITLVPGTTFTVTSGAGTVVLSGSTVTVTGLAPGETTSVQITASTPTALDATTTVSGSALLTGVTPVLGAPVRTADGFTFEVTNYDAATGYTVAATDGSVSISGSTVTVTGLAASASSLVTVTAAQPGHTVTSATQLGISLAAGTVPLFSAPTPLAGGYRFTITNYDAAQTYTLVQAAGTATRVGDTVTVSGLGNGVTSGTTVTVARDGYVDASATRTGTSLPDGVAPVASPVTRTADGFTFTITLVPGTTFAVTSSAGTVVLSGSLVTVTGLAPGEATSVQITASTPTALDATATVSGTALLTGTAPELGAPSRTADGFTFEVTNYDATSAYAASATTGSVTVSGSTVTVTGLLPGADSTVTVTASKAGYTDASAATTGTALLAGVAPVFDAPTRTPDGFTFSVTNLDAAASYVVTATDGSVSLTGSTVTVTGLLPGAGSTVTVTMSRTGYTDAAASQSSTALDAGITPLFGAPTRTPDGFTFTVTNLDAASTYAVVATNGSATMSGSTVTVTGLAPGAASTVTVTVSRVGSTDASADQSGSALTTGVTPLFGTPTRTADGFTFEVTNLDATSTYAVSATTGSVTISGSTVTVTGLLPGADSTVTVTVSRTGDIDAAAAISDSALLTGVTPVFSTPTRTADGFSFAVTNYDATSTYAVVATDGSVTISGSTVTVTGLTPGAGSLVTVTTSHVGYTDASAAQSGLALLTGITPVLGAPTRTADGFTFELTNLDPDATYALVATAGSVALSGSTVTVTGLAYGGASTVTVTSSRAGYTDASAAQSGNALLAGIAPELGTPTRTADGYTFEVTNLDATSTYAVTATTGSVTMLGSTVTVTGLLPGAASTVTVTVSKTGHTDAAAAVSDSALLTGVAPVFGTPTRTPDGYTVALTNYDATSVYAVVATDGSVTISGSMVTVTGLTPGAASTVTVTASHVGYTDASADQSGNALGAGTAPLFSVSNRLAAGYQFTITNFDPTATYTLVQADGGTASLDATTVTVSGLPAGVTSTTTVTVSKAGYVDASGSTAGTSLADGIAPVASAPASTADGFTFTITLAPGTTYTVTSDAGTVVLSGNTVTVTGLAPGQAASVHITASASGSLDASTEVSGSALTTGILPTFGTPTRTAEGYTVEVTNYDATSTYALVATDGSVTMSGPLLTVTGVAPAAGSLVTVTVSHAGQTDAVGSVSGTALGTGTAPAFSAATPMDGGYWFTITNYDPSQTYSLVQADGGTASRDGDTVTVSGLGAGVASTTTVTVARVGYVDASASQAGSSLPHGVVPATSVPASTADGFTFTITLEPGTTYVVTSDEGTVVLSGSTVTVTGLPAGGTTTVHITASAPGALDESTSVPGSALLASIAPTFSAPLSNVTGFVVSISNYDPATSYDVSTTAGIVTRVGAQLTVTGLAPSGSAAVHVIAIRSGYQSVGASVTGYALAPVSTPTPPPVTEILVPTLTVPTPTPATTPTGGSNTTGGAPVLAQLQESAAGTGAVTNGGTTVSSTVTKSGGTVKVDANNGLSMTVAAGQKGATLPLGPDGVVEVGPGGELWVTVTGFEQGSLITLWSLGSPAQLGSASTDASGAAATRIVVPAGLSQGAHTLVVTGVDAQGNSVTMQVGIRVTTAQPGSVASPADYSWWPWSLALLLLLMMAGWWFAIARRRRRDEDETA